MAVEQSEQLIRTYCIPIYRFAALPEKIQEKVIRYFQNEVLSDEVSWTLQDYCTYRWKEKLESLGYMDPRIYYDFSYSQGHGLSFTAVVDIRKWLKAHKLANTYRRVYNNASDIDIRLKSIDNFYCHKRTVRTVFEVYQDIPDDHLLYRQVEAVADLIEDERLDLCVEFQREGEAEIEYWWKDENVIRYIDEGDYWFEEDGSVRVVYDEPVRTVESNVS